MIVWLASYPRSGNTLTRLILAQAFGCRTSSVYEEERLPPAADRVQRDTPIAEVAARIGIDFLDTRSPEILRDAGAELHLVKTHDPPPDDGPAIYVVRDGRAAVMSYVQFLRRFDGLPNVSVAEVVRGDVGMGSWSAHLDAWRPLERPGTLLLRFEDLVARPAEAIAQLAKFIGRPPVAAWSNPFAALHELAPDFFRSGSNLPGIAAFGWTDILLFWQRHGAWMERLGYGAYRP